MGWALAALYGFLGLYIWPLGQGFWPSSAAWFTDFGTARGLKAGPNPLVTLQAVAVILYAVYAWRNPTLTTSRMALHHLLYFAASFVWLAVFPLGYQVFLYVVPLVGIALSFGLALFLRWATR